MILGTELHAKDVVLKSNGEAWMVAADCQKACSNILLHSSDWGVNWTKLVLESVEPARVWASAGGNVWVRDNSGRLYSSSDDGQTWFVAGK